MSTIAFSTHNRHFTCYEGILNEAVTVKAYWHLNYTHLCMTSHPMAMCAGGTRILRHSHGCAALNGLLFHKKSLNMGPIFYKNISKHGSIFQKFSGVCEHPKILKHGPRYFREKSQKPVSVKMTLKNG